MEACTIPGCRLQGLGVGVQGLRSMFGSCTTRNHLKGALIAAPTPADQAAGSAAGMLQVHTTVQELHGTQQPAPDLDGPGSSLLMHRHWLRQHLPRPTGRRQPAGADLGSLGDLEDAASQGVLGTTLRGDAGFLQRSAELQA